MAKKKTTTTLPAATVIRGPKAGSPEETATLERLRAIAPPTIGTIVVDAEPARSIPPEQLDRMLARYADAIQQRAKFDGVRECDIVIERAAGAIAGARLALADGQYDDARHLTGLVQGILLCRDICTWEWLTSDEQRT